MYNNVPKHSVVMLNFRKLSQYSQNTWDSNKYSEGHENVGSIFAGCSLLLLSFSLSSMRVFFIEMGPCSMCPK